MAAALAVAEQMEESSDLGKKARSLLKDNTERLPGVPEDIKLAEKIGVVIGDSDLPKRMADERAHSELLRSLGLA